MAGYARNTSDLIQFLRDVEDVRHFNWSRALFLRTVKGALGVRRNLDALPGMQLSVGDDECGRALRKFLEERTLRLSTRSAAAVLPLPAKGCDYLKGRQRERVRTNIARANDIGLTCRAVCPEMFRDALDASILVGSPIKYLEKLLAEPVTAGMEHWLGFDAAGEAVAFVRLQKARDIAWLKCLTTIHDDPRSVIRYKISAEIFMDLAERQFSTVISGSAVGLPDGLLFFQHLLGFRATRLEIISLRDGADPVPNRGDQPTVDRSAVGVAEIIA